MGKSGRYGPSLERNVAQIELGFGSIWAVGRDSGSHLLWKQKWELGKSGRYEATLEGTVSENRAGIWADLGGVERVWIAFFVEAEMGVGRIWAVRK